MRTWSEGQASAGRTHKNCTSASQSGLGSSGEPCPSRPGKSPGDWSEPCSLPQRRCGPLQWHCGWDDHSPSTRKCHWAHANGRLLPTPARWEAAVRSCHVPLPLTPSSVCAHLTILVCWGRGQPGHGSPTRTPFSDLVSEKLKSDCLGVFGGPPAGSRGKKGNGTHGANASVPAT